MPVTPFSLASGCPKNFSCWLIGDFSPSTWQKFFITKRSDAEGTHPDHEHRHCRPACFLSHLRPPYHPAFATSPPTNAIFVSFHWSCGLECTICRASKSIQVFAWLLSVRWRSIALAVMTNSIVHGRRLAAVPSLPPKKTGPRNSTVAPWLGRFPSGALQNHLQCFHPIGVFSAGVDSRPVPPPTAESGAGNTEPLQGQSAKVATRPPFASFLLSAVPDGAKTCVAADHLVRAATPHRPPRHQHAELAGSLPDLNRLDRSSKAGEHNGPFPRFGFPPCETAGNSAFLGRALREFCLP